MIWDDCKEPVFVNEAQISMCLQPNWSAVSFAHKTPHLQLSQAKKKKN